MKMFLVLRFGILFLVVSLSCSVLALPGNGPAKDPLKYILGQDNLGPLRNGISENAAQAPGPSDYGSNNTLVLAAKRTDRPDILHGFKHYRGGWNITDPHYWADDFHGEAMNTLKYVVNQSDYTVQTLKNVTEYLSLAKTINIAQLVLPSNVMDDIDKLNVDLNAAADTLTEKTSENAGKIVKVFNAVYVSESLAVSIDYCGCSDACPGSAWFFSFLLVTDGRVFISVLSILGHQHAIHIFVVSGWLLVAVTFILCGVFILLNNAISDTCLAMEEWVENPHAASALSSILPCVDQRTTNNTLVQSKEVITDIVNVVNTYIYTFANANPSQTEFNYYNQSGPSMPPLCYPFDSLYQDRQCEPREVSMANASVVWQNYTCMVSSSGLCTTVGRVIPDIYRQLVAAVNESYALEYYTPVLLSLQDCKFVRDIPRNHLESLPSIGELSQDCKCGAGLDLSRSFAVSRSLDTICKLPPKGGSVCEDILANKMQQWLCRGRNQDGAKFHFELEIIAIEIIIGREKECRIKESETNGRISDIDRLAELRGLRRLHGEFRWGERRRRIWSLPLIEVLEICVFMVLICYGAGRGREECVWIGKEGVGGKELTRGEMGFAEALVLKGIPHTILGVTSGSSSQQFYLLQNGRWISGFELMNVGTVSLREKTGDD
ncbi:hypothetical protein POTOM_036044 [Populus tomentosa]|uniref:Uncharacterized protein n=1 Tax=Populus tomentosa TaxID=118781 RepID=A0A8X8CEQ4_POPTO|nr:hypothetical protein POTOM_036044 [Populus tomentosa]